MFGNVAINTFKQSFSDSPQIKDLKKNKLFVNKVSGKIVEKNLLE